jgi:hypothetical protein
VKKLNSTLKHCQKAELNASGFLRLEMGLVWEGGGMGLEEPATQDLQGLKYK